MLPWFSALDRILRGETARATDPNAELRAMPTGGMLALIVALGALYGFGMGSFSLFQEGGPVWAQFFASAVKIPLLFLLTLLITFPSLYVFNALVGSQLGMGAVFRLLVAGLAIIVAVLASFGPIVAFFSVSTTSYPFMVLLNVAMCTTGGVLGLVFLQRTLHRMTLAPQGAKPVEPAAVPEPPPLPGRARAGALERVGVAPGDDVKKVFRCWVVLFALVGSQMSWVLRPFIGHPGKPFTFFREREDNFFSAVWGLFLSLFQ